MNDEIGYIVAVESMTEYRLRRDVGGGAGPPGGTVPGDGPGAAADAGADAVAGSGAAPDPGTGVGSLVRVGRGSRPQVAVVGGMVSAIHEELQPYLPSSLQPRYLPSQEDYSDSYFRLIAIGHLPGEGEADHGKEEGASVTVEGGARMMDPAPPALHPSVSVFTVASVPALGDPVVPMTDADVARFHTRGGEWSMGYLQDLMRQVDPEVIYRLVDRTRIVAVSGGFAGQAGLMTKFSAIRRYVGRGVVR